jgi:GNAT superfamily N-acetyltransferase
MSFIDSQKDKFRMELIRRKFMNANKVLRNIFSLNKTPNVLLTYTKEKPLIYKTAEELCLDSFCFCPCCNGDDKRARKFHGKVWSINLEKEFNKIVLSFKKEGGFNEGWNFLFEKNPFKSLKKSSYKNSQPILIVGSTTKTGNIEGFMACSRTIRFSEKFDDEDEEEQINEIEAEYEFHVELIYVVPSARKKKLGAALAALAEEYVREDIKKVTGLAYISGVKISCHITGDSYSNYSNNIFRALECRIESTIDISKYEISEREENNCEILIDLEECGWEPHIEVAKSTGRGEGFLTKLR